ncbi:hypothetical protein Taro_041942 [Colocasia esculenta]|uniref:Uncharacterized protein n=1 Tax=Colocasia esculenta TaxID=4460 RepID=A0A843WMQ5_COLES|nr:hypothetical protein [Colocasia esculenta]
MPRVASASCLTPLVLQESCLARLWLLVVLLPLSFGVPAALAGKGLVIPIEPCSRGSPPYFLQSASLLELSRCFVCHVAPLVECCNTCLWLLSALCWLVVSSGEVLPEFFSTGSGGSEKATPWSSQLGGDRLAVAFWFRRRRPYGRVLVTGFLALVLVPLLADGPPEGFREDIHITRTVLTVVGSQKATGHSVAFRMRCSDTVTQGIVVEVAAFGTVMTKRFGSHTHSAGQAKRFGSQTILQGRQSDSTARPFRRGRQSDSTARPFYRASKTIRQPDHSAGQTDSAGVLLRGCRFSQTERKGRAHRFECSNENSAAFPLISDDGGKTWYSSTAMEIVPKVRCMSKNDITRMAHDTGSQGTPNGRPSTLLNRQGDCSSLCDYALAMRKTREPRKIMILQPYWDPVLKTREGYERLVGTTEHSTHMDTIRKLEQGPDIDYLTLGVQSYAKWQFCGLERSPKSGRYSKIRSRGMGGNVSWRSLMMHGLHHNWRWGPDIGLSLSISPNSPLQRFCRVHDRRKEQWEGAVVHWFGCP